MIDSLVCLMMKFCLALSLASVKTHQRFSVLASMWILLILISFLSLRIRFCLIKLRKILVILVLVILVLVILVLLILVLVIKLFNLERVYPSPLILISMIDLFLVIDPFTGAAIATGIGSLISGIFGSSSSSSSNKTNMKINREQIAYDREKMKSQMDWQERMWNAENAYNDPSAQKQRLVDAGINPYFAMGNNPSGMASSAGSAPSGGAPSMLPVHPVDYSALGRGISDAVAQYYSAKMADSQSQKLQEEAYGQHIENRFKAFNNLLNFMERLSKVSVNKSTAKKLGLEASQLFKESDWRAEGVRLDAERNSKMVSLLEQQVETEKVVRNLYQSNIRLNESKMLEVAQSIVESASRISANYANAYLLRQKGKTEGEIRTKVRREADRIIYEVFGDTHDQIKRDQMQDAVERNIESEIFRRSTQNVNDGVNTIKNVVRN